MLTEEQILWDVVEEHFAEAEFLFEQWLSARRSALYQLAELRDGPEQRLLAHVDGLVVNGPLALERVAWPVIEGGDVPTSIAAAALAVLESGDVRVLEALEAPRPEAAPEEDELADAEPDPDDAMPEDVEALSREALAEAAQREREQGVAEGEEPDDPPPPELDEAAAPPPPEVTEAPEVDPRIEGLALAVALSSHPKLDDQLRARVAKAKGATLALLLQGCADRGIDAGTGLDHALTQDDPVVLTAALRAAAFSDRRRLLAAVEALLQHPVLSVRQAALDTGFAWGSRHAWQMALYAYKQPGGRSAMVWLACMGDDRHAEALVPLLDDDALRPDVLWALGFSGRVPAVDACCKWLDHDDETTRRLAGEAVAAIVGLDPDDETLWEPPPPSDESPAGLEGDDPAEDVDDLDADLTGGPDDELPLPNAEAIRKWWADHRSAFVPGQRYLLGKTVGREGPGWVLPMLSCRRVDVIAREVVARTHGVGRWPERTASPRHLTAASGLIELARQAGVMKNEKR